MLEIEGRLENWRQDASVSCPVLSTELRPPNTYDLRNGLREHFDMSDAAPVESDLIVLYDTATALCATPCQTFVRGLPFE